MPRVNIYVPDDLDLALRQYPGEINVSRICATALRAELAALISQRTQGPFPALHRDMTLEEVELCALSDKLRFAFRAYSGEPSRQHESIGFFASVLLDEMLMEGQQLAIGGGRQMWQIATRLQRRNLGVTIWALGVGDVDREAPLLHPNSIATLLCARYPSRSAAKLVGTRPGFKEAWILPAIHPDVLRDVQRVIIGSCSMFDPDSAYARLLGNEVTDFLMEKHVMGDFLGLFITPDGQIVTPYAPSVTTASFIPASDLEQLAKRDDTLVILATGGEHKVKLIWQLLQLGLFNVLVTDELTSEALHRYRKQVDRDPAATPVKP